MSTIESTPEVYSAHLKLASTGLCLVFDMLLTTRARHSGRELDADGIL